MAEQSATLLDVLSWLSADILSDYSLALLSPITPPPSLVGGRDWTRMFTLTRAHQSASLRAAVGCYHGTSDYTLLTTDSFLLTVFWHYSQHGSILGKLSNNSQLLCVFRKIILCQASVSPQSGQYGRHSRKLKYSTSCLKATGLKDKFSVGFLISLLRQV